MSIFRDRMTGATVAADIDDNDDDDEDDEDDDDNDVYLLPVS